MNKELFKSSPKLDITSRIVLQLCRSYPVDTLSISEISMLLIAGGNRFAYHSIESTFNKLLDNKQLPKRYLGAKMN